MSGAIIAVGVLQGVLDRVHLGWAASLKVSVERGVHAAEQGRGHLRSAELAVLDGIHPGRHPAGANQSFVGLGLIPGGSLDGSLVEPDVRNMIPKENPVGRGLPRQPEQNRLLAEGSLSARRPNAFCDEVLEIETLAAAPQSRSGVDRQHFNVGFAITDGSGLTGGRDQRLIRLNLNFLQLPHHAFPQAKTWLIFEEKHVILSRPLGVSPLEYRHRRGLRVGGKERSHMHDGAELDVS